jgi:hypothetical protein
VYTGIDWIISTTAAGLEHSFLVRAGSDPSAIRLRLNGSPTITIDPEGNATISSGRLSVRHGAPRAFQTVGGIRREIPAKYRVKDGSELTFELGSIDPTRDLLIDPYIYTVGTTYSTYLGGSGAEFGWRVAADAAGSAYVGGHSGSANFPTVSAIQTSGDVFVAKFDPTGSRLIYATYLGGTDDEAFGSLAVDAGGSAYVVGRTNSSDLPLVNPVQSNLRGGFDAFVMRLSPAGNSIEYSTYYGGGGSEEAKGVAVDALRNAYVTGSTSSVDFPVQNALQGSRGTPAACGLWWSCRDGFVVRLTAAGTGVAYATYLGGENEDDLRDVAVDASQRAYVVGYTASHDLPSSVGAAQRSSGGRFDALIAVVDSAGALAALSYLGGLGTDEGWGVAIDSSSNVYVTGFTFSTDFPVVNAFRTEPTGTCHFGPCMDAFVAKLDNTASAVLYATLLGGADMDQGQGIAVDGEGRAIVVGETRSSDFPTFESPLTGSTCELVPGFPEPCTDGFVAVLRPDGSSLEWSTFVGGPGADSLTSVATDSAGSVYAAGYSYGLSGFPLVAPFQATLNGWSDAVVMKMTPSKRTVIAKEDLPAAEWIRGIVFCFEPPRLPEIRWQGDAIAMRRCPPGECARCLPELGRGLREREMPPQLLEMEASLIAMHVAPQLPLAPKAARRLRDMIDAAGAESIPAAGPPSSRGDTREMRDDVTKATNAMELNARLPKLIPLRLPGRSPAYEFGGLATIQLVTARPAEAPTLDIRPGLSRTPAGYRPAWPVFHYVVGWTRADAADVDLALGGLDFRVPISLLRVFQETSEGFVDVTRGHDSRRRILRARMTAPGTLIVVAPTPRTKK